MLFRSPAPVVATNRFRILAGDQFGNLISSFDQQADVGELADRFEVNLSSWDRGYQSNANISGPIAGQFVVSFASTVAGWFTLAITFDGSHIQRSPSSLYVNSGVASALLSYPCQHQGKGCYGGIRSDPGFPTCSRLISSVDCLFCSTASDTSPVLGYVRIRDRWANDRNEPHWEDFIRYNVTAVSRAGLNVLLFSEEGCFDGSSQTCSSTSPKSRAINYDSQGLLLPSNQYAGKNTFLYAISFVATRSGTYLASLAHGIVVDSVTRVIDGGVSLDPRFLVNVLPGEPCAGTSLAEVMNQTVAGAMSNISVVTLDRFNNSRVVSVFGAFGALCCTYLLVNLASLYAGCCSGLG